MSCNFPAIFLSTIEPEPKFGKFKFEIKKSQRNGTCNKCRLCLAHSLWPNKVRTSVLAPQHSMPDHTHTHTHLSAGKKRSLSPRLSHVMAGAQLPSQPARTEQACGEETQRRYDKGTSETRWTSQSRDNAPYCFFWRPSSPGPPELHSSSQRQIQRSACPRHSRTEKEAARGYLC